MKGRWIPKKSYIQPKKKAKYWTPTVKMETSILFKGMGTDHDNIIPIYDISLM
jgi:hypothetical protein